MLDALIFSGFVDGYYAWNANHPSTDRNFIPGTGTTAARSNTLGLNLVDVEVARDPKPIGFHLSLIAGDGADVVHSGEPHRQPYRNLYQASVSYKAPVGRGLLLEPGVYPSHLGNEGLFSRDNWDYTRGWIGEFSAYYQTGIKASYVWNDQWSAQLHVVKGWQRMHDNNSAKSIGTQIAYSNARSGIVFNTFIGPELDNDNKHLRLFGDLVATFKASSKLALAG